MVLTRNFFLPFWILFPVGPSLLKEDIWEISSKSEKKFISDKRFFIPLHIIIYTATLVWVWCLMVVSDTFHVDNWIFNSLNPRTNGEFFLLSSSIGVLAAFDAIAGHELLHKREWYNKIVGTWSYTKFFYSHFFDEHI
jgi:hypothetical protein